MSKQKWICVIPDVLTVSRLFFGLSIGLMGFFGLKALPTVVFLLMAAWTTDILDGRLARWAKDKWNRPESKIGKNEIRFDSFLIDGVLAYLGYVQLIPIWLAISYGGLLFFLAIKPNSSYKANFVFEAPATIATFLFVVIAAGKPVMGYVSVWGVLLLLYDWKRAMQLAGTLKTVLVTTGQRFFRLAKQYHILLGGLIFVWLLLLVIFGPRSLQIKTLGGVIVSIFLGLIYLGWESR